MPDPTTTGLASLESSPRAVVRLARATTPRLTRGLWLTILLATAAGAGRIVTPLTVQYALDHGLLHPEPGSAVVIQRAVVIGGLATITAVLASWWLNQRIYRSIERALAQLRTAGLARIHAMLPETAAATRSADLVTRLTSDVDAVTTFTQNGGVVLLVNLMQMVLAGVIITIYSWQLALPVLAIALALTVLMTRIQAVVAARFSIVRESISTLQSTVGEAVSGIAVVRSTGTGDRVRRGMDEAIGRTESAQRRTLVPLHVNTAIGEIAISTMTVVVVVLGVRWSSGASSWEPSLGLTAGEIIAMLLLVTFFVRPLQSLVQMLGEAQNAIVGWRRALEIVATPAGTIDAAGSLELAPGAIRVDLRDVAVGYGDGPSVVRHLDVSIAAGEHVAVVGETGSGKSTFAKLVTRQLAARDGEVLLGGVPIDVISHRSFERRVAIVPQEPFLFDVSIAENILMGDTGSTPALDDIVEALGLGSWLDGLPAGLATRVGVRGERLSAGERQLVALARTVLVDPDLLVLDEATSGIDPATDVLVQRALAALTVGCTTISIAHRMVTARGADRVLVFDGGRIVQNGTHDELIERPGTYAGLHRAWTGHVDLP